MTMYELHVTKADGTTEVRIEKLQEAKRIVNLLRHKTDVVAMKIVKPEWVYGSYTVHTRRPAVRELVAV